MSDATPRARARQTGRPAIARRSAVAALALLAAPTVAHAALRRPVPGVRAAADSTSRYEIDLPAGPLTESLAHLARQTGVRIVVDARTLAGREAPAIRGRLTAGEAARRLVEGSGLVVRVPDAWTLAVATAGTDRTRTLGRVLVTGTATPARGYAATTARSATRTDTRLRDVPQAVSIVTRDLIADQAMQGMADVVRYVPGVQMGQGEGHRDAPTIRGNSSTADFFVDGVRDDAQYFRDLYNVERVEALKGANALTFGRGGGGGVINRVSKEAQWTPTRVLTLAGGAYDHRRGVLDAGQGLDGTLAGRVTGMYERSGGFREASRVLRYGVNPTLAVAAGANTTVRLGYEHFVDDRRIDRGVPSFRGVPSTGPISEYFGDPDQSRGVTRVHAANANVEHALGAATTLRNRTRAARYDKGYQNVFPGAVNAAGTRVALSAYGNVHDRTNLFNQTELTTAVRTGDVAHTLLVGGEVGQQTTDNYRKTGYFGNTATSLEVPFAQPTVSTPITFRQSATDADNRVVSTVASAFVQDQLALGAHVQAIVGARYEQFALRFRNDRNGQRLSRTDRMLSPRAGLVVKPVAPLSLYGSYGMSYLPSAGDQFSSLTATTQTLAPEQFRNREVGAKWDVRPELSFTGALYRLDRSNTSAPDPLDAARVVQTGRQRTTGHELGVTGRVASAWQITGGYAAQRARIVSTTSAARAGAAVPLVPRQTFSLWNRVRLHPMFAAGVGVVQQTRMFAAIDNSVTLPGFTRVDAAAFVTVRPGVQAQLNVENLLDGRYYATSHGNNNILPGAPRTLRLSLSVGR